jgi:hypothetical protein
VRFQATVELGGKTATGIHVPDEVVAALGSSKRPPVRATVNDHTYRSTVARMGGRFMLPVSVLGIEEAKTPETRQRRIDKAIARLEEGRAQR